MQDDQAAFLRAIRDDPDNDTPRLAYADWLQEHDDPDRAEFIRVQCEKNRLSHREQELLKAHGKKWLKELFGKRYQDFVPHQTNGTFLNPFSRGFVDVVSCNIDQLYQHFDNWMATTPLEKLILRSVDDESVNNAFQRAEDQLRAITQNPLFKKIKYVSVNDWYGEMRTYSAILKKAEKTVSRQPNNGLAYGSIFADKNLQKPQAIAHDHFPITDDRGLQTMMPYFVWDRASLGPLKIPEPTRGY